MSTALAVGAVTAVIRGLLTERLATAATDLGGNNPNVTVLPPDLVVPPETDLTDTLNLFLYQVTPNPSWRNVDYPARDSTGDRVSYPPLALDLHYLLSAYSQEPFRAEIMLGHAMQVIHESGVLPRPLIRRRLGLDLQPGDPPAPQELTVFANSTLDTQVEMVKITLDSLSIEKISELWSAFQTNYRPTVAYHVSVVLIESDRPAKSALPVRERRLFVLPFKRPVINAVQPQLLTTEATLTIQGFNLRADVIRIRFDGDLQEPPAPENVTDNAISISLPISLQAGVRTVQVIHYLNYEPDPTNPPDFREGFESNICAFILIPEIISAQPISAVQGETLELSVAPPIGQLQQVALLLRDDVIESAPRSSEESTTLSFAIPDNFAPDIYIARLRIDGAESELQTDSDGVYNAPTITILEAP